MSENLTSSRLLLVEGATDKGVFDSLLRNLEIEDVVVENCRGKDNMPEKLESLETRTGYGGLTRLGVVRDADDSAASAYESIANALRRGNLPVPGVPNEFATVGQLSVSVLILPGGNRTGSLDTLLTETIPQNTKSCIDEFFRCAEVDPGPKRIASAFVSLQQRPESSLATFANQGVWDLNNGAFAPLRTFLYDLFAD